LRLERLYRDGILTHHSTRLTPPFDACTGFESSPLSPWHRFSLRGAHPTRLSNEPKTDSRAGPPPRASSIQRLVCTGTRPLVPATHHAFDVAHGARAVATGRRHGVPRSRAAGASRRAGPACGRHTARVRGTVGHARHSAGRKVCGDARARGRLGEAQGARNVRPLPRPLCSRENDSIRLLVCTRKPTNNNMLQKLHWKPKFLLMAIHDMGW